MEAELSGGSFPFAAGDEDIHMAIERRLTEIVGPVGGRLHTARSRNDQVVTDLAMYTRERALAAVEHLGWLMEVLLERAEEHADWAMPGYTHLQRAQPVYLGHHLLAYFWMFDRDRERFAFAERQCGRLPLGSGALAGVNFDTDRRQVAAELGFERRVPRTRWTPSPAATSRSTTSVRRRPAPPTCRGSGRSSCCGPAASSASASCRTRGARAPR